jgi:hypothetical protein
MIPRFGREFFSESDEETSEIRFKQMICIMDSMNDQGVLFHIVFYLYVNFYN